MTLALRVVADVFVFVIVAGVGGFFVLLAAARFGMWRERRRDVRTAQQRHPASGFSFNGADLIDYPGVHVEPFDPDNHDDIAPHARQGCQQCADDLAELRRVRAQLELRAVEASWSLPTYNKESSR